MAAQVVSTPTSGNQNPAQLTEILWQDAVTKLHETNNELLLPIDIDEVIGVAGVSTLAGRLHALIGQPVVTFQDKQIGFLRVMPAPAFFTGSNSGPPLASAELRPTPAVNNQSGKGKSAVKDTKVPRPPNAFILYRQHHHDLLKSANPNLHNNDISVICGRQWKNEIADVKNQYKAVADRLKRKHAEDNPNYVYSPRKPSEKKRRMTARKAAALSGSSDAVAGPSALASTVPSISPSGSVAGPHVIEPVPYAATVPAVLAPIAPAAVSAPIDTSNVSTSVGTIAFNQIVAPASSEVSQIASQVSPAATVSSTSSPTSNVNQSMTVGSPLYTFHAADPESDDHSSPSLIEFEDRSLGSALPMSDDALNKLLEGHNDFLSANPGMVEPLTLGSFTLDFREPTADKVANLDSLVNWNQVRDDFDFNFREDGNDFCAFFEQELDRLTSDE